MSLPDWNKELELTLREVYFAAPLIETDGPSMHGGIKAVYEYVKALAEEEDNA